MPEGPSIVILKEESARFAGKIVISATGNAKVDMDRLAGQRIAAIESWGKQLLIGFDGFFIRIHLLMFGSYRINERKDTPPRLSLAFDDGELNFYTCSVRMFEGNFWNHYDPAADVMSDDWDARKAKKKLKAKPSELICDVLLDQDIFAGVGNIIKNEVLYRVRVHPESTVGEIPDTKLREVVAEARTYSFEFLDWKKQYVLKKHWLAHTKKTCKRCDLPLVKKHTGKRKRRSFFCKNCQKLYR